MRKDREGQIGRGGSGELLCGDGTVLYLGGYINLNMQYNHFRPTHLNTCINSENEEGL